MSRLFPGERIFRHEVPVDDEWHSFRIVGNPLHVACRRLAVVEFWARANNDPGVSRMFRVVGTGHLMPDAVTYWGTAVTADLVWHLVERAS